MQRRNSVLLRSVFSAAIVCAVLGAATFNGPDRAAFLTNGNRETAPILVRSISTIKMPVCSATRNLISEPAPAPGEGTVWGHWTPVQTRPRRSMTVPSRRANRPALSRPRSRILRASGRAQCSFDKLDRGIVGRGCGSPSSDPISKSCDVSSFRGCRLSIFSRSVSMPDANGLDPSTVMSSRYTRRAQPWNRKESPVRTRKSWL
jgi:hypothetical protein